MIAIIDCPIHVEVQPNLIISDAYKDIDYMIDTFDITHEVIPGTPYFKVIIKHLGEGNEALHDLELTVNYEDLKNIYTAPATALTAIYNHYANAIDDFAYKCSEDDSTRSSIAFYRPEEKDAPLLLVIFKDDTPEKLDEEMKNQCNEFKSRGYNRIHCIKSPMTHREYDKLIEKCTKEHTSDPYFDKYDELYKSYKESAGDISKEAIEDKKDDGHSPDLFDEFMESLKNTEGVEVTEF